MLIEAVPGSRVRLILLANFAFFAVIAFEFPAVNQRLNRKGAKVAKTIKLTRSPISVILVLRSPLKLQSPRPENGLRS